MGGPGCQSPEMGLLVWLQQWGSPCLIAESWRDLQAAGANHLTWTRLLELSCIPALTVPWPQGRGRLCMPSTTAPSACSERSQSWKGTEAQTQVFLFRF